MNKGNVIQEKTYQFSLDIIELYKVIIKSHKEYNLSSQLLRSATSIGANVEESIGGSSKKDFIAKIQIAYREARESSYWIRLLKDSNYIKPDIADKLLKQCDEILKILSSIRLTAMKNIHNS